MLKSKVIDELISQSSSMLDLLVEAGEHDGDFILLRELLEQFDDELKAISDE